MQPSLTTADLDQAIAKSVQIILQYQDKTGAYPASPNFSPYNYCWLRDGSFIANAMSRVGEIRSAEKFFNWSSSVIESRKDLILSGGFLDARYTLDGQESTEQWGNFQLDGFGLLLWAIKEHSNRHHCDDSPYQAATGLIQHYLATNWQIPSIDWWEERTGLHSTSLACIYAGLNAYQHPEATKLKSALNLADERIDASLLACPLLGAISPADFKSTLSKIETNLVSIDGGVYRYREDTYYGGGEWPVLTSMLGSYYLVIDRLEDAQTKMQYLINHMQPNGWLEEQSRAYLLHPEAYSTWVEKHGQPANPLLWSQAMLIILAVELKQYLS